MADFTAQVFQNQFLPDGGTEVHAIVAVSCANAGSAGASGTGAAEILIIDSSGSMDQPRTKMRSARQAATVALGEILDGTEFAVIAGRDYAEAIYPASGMAVMSPERREQARAAVAHVQSGGGTAIGSWLTLAGSTFASASASQCHAILLTDGRNESEHADVLHAAVAAARGRFQCDCRGVGANWEVAELRGIATELLGTVDLIADPADMEADFESMIRTAMARGVADVTLRIWAPQGAEIAFVKQVAPTIEDLTNRRTEVGPLIGAYPTGAWGDENREYHVAVRVAAKPVGSEQLVARVQLDVDGVVVAQGLVKALWSDDEALTTQINPAVAHYTGQAELASAIQDGLNARAAGDDATATLKLGRAAQLAAETGNTEVTKRLQKVVDVEDPATGTVRLKRDIDKLDAMALDTASTKTTRVK